VVELRQKTSACFLSLSHRGLIMGSFEVNIPHHRYKPWLRFVMIGLNIVALALTVILSWHYVKGGSMPGCSGGSPCEQVLSGRWSTIGGVIPVSSLAMGVYLTMLVASFFINPYTDPEVRLLAWKVLLLLAGAIAGTAIWFIIVQKWFIGEFCPYCMTLHITGLLISTLICWQAGRVLNPKVSLAAKPSKVQNISTTSKPLMFHMRVTGLILIGLLMSGLLVAGQVAFTPKTPYQSGKSQEALTAIDYSTAPIIGSPEAPYVVKLLFDYQCPHCQKLHFMVSEAVQRYGGKLAFILCPAPLNTQCNPYIPRDVDAFKNSCELARIGLGVWNAKPEVFATFENWMFTYDSGDKWQPRSLEGARAKAAELTGKEKLDDAIASNWVEKYMQSCIQVYGQTMQEAKGGIPKLVYGSNWVIPEPRNVDDLIMILQKSLGVPKP
jgi:uncharacterized membrane protein